MVLGASPNVFVMPKSLPSKLMKQFIDKAKADPWKDELDKSSRWHDASACRWKRDVTMYRTIIEQANLRIA
jgi:hypothetical protein